MQRQQRRRAWPRSLLLAAIVALAALATLQTTSAADVCAAATCKESGATCTRSSGSCPVCLTVTTFFFTSTTYCTDPSRIGECPNGYTKCPAPTPAPSPTPSPTVKPTAAPSPSPSLSPTAKPTPKPSTSPTATSPTPGSTSKPTPTSGSSSSGSPLAGAKAANTNSSSESAAANEARSESSQLKPASVDTPTPDIAVSTTGDSGSSSSIWIIIVACAVVACVVAAVFGARYAARRRREARDDSEIGVLGGKDLDVFPVAQRQTTTTEFSDSALDLNTTPSTSKFAYVPAGRTTGTMNRGSAAIGGAETGVILQSETMWRHTASHNSFRGSQHINMSYIMDDPLTASQLSTSVPQPARESRDVFPAPESPVSSEWATSGYFDPDGGHNSANTEFYSSKISEITSADDDQQFAHRSSESLTDKDSAKWKQKFYVEL